jgi:hypothetical protein
MPEAAIGPIIGGVAGIAGSALQGSSAGAGAAAAQKIAEQQRADLAPFRATGGLANTASANLLGLNGQDAQTSAFGNFRTDPGYQWQMDQGLRAVDAGAAAKGMLRSGATLKAEQTFGTGLADQSFNQYYNRLFSMAQLGENAASGGSSTANAAAGLAQGAGNTQASIFGDASKGISGLANSLFGPGGGFASNGGGLPGVAGPVGSGFLSGGLF